MSTKDYLNVVREEWQNFRKENKEWAKLEGEYKMRVQRADEKLQCLLDGDDGRRALHGNRRSAYAAPYQFDFSISDYVDSIDSLIEEISYKVEIKLAEKRRKLYEQGPIGSHRLNANPDENFEKWLERSQYETSSLLHPVQTGEVDNTINMTSRALLHKVIEDKMSYK